MSRPRSPGLARRALARTLPPDVRDDILGDLEEMYTRTRRAHGPARARFWFWQQTLSFAVLFLAERIRERRRHTDMGPRVSSIDFRLALRMLVRYPGLTIVGVLGMAVGITIAAAAFTVGRNMTAGLPFPDADRVVAMLLRDVRTGNRESRALHELLIWRQELHTLDAVGAFRSVSRNLIAPGAQPATVVVAEMTASGFDIAGIPAAHGRHLVPADERADAQDVVVISDAVWRRRFGGDPGILGRTLQLGGQTHTVVGIMPPGFAFPVNDDYWVPLRLPVSAPPRTGSPITAFGRLAPGVTLAAAQAEITALGERVSAASPATHEYLRPRVTPYTYNFTDMDDPDMRMALRATQLMIVLLLVLVCVNVAILVYARTATRQGEIAIRTALGASRGRIVTQLFLEALVLAGVAAVAGIGLLGFGLERLDAAVDQIGFRLPFWMDFTLKTGDMVPIVGLCLLAAAVVGIVPALKATGRRVQGRLQSLSAGAGSRMQMGRLWTLLIVAQVTVAVAALPATVYYAWDALTFRLGDPGYAAHAFLTGQVVMEEDTQLVTTADRERDTRAAFARHQGELERRLEEDPGVAGVTFSIVHPGQELAAVLEIEGMPLPLDSVDYNIVEGTKQGHLVRFNRVALDFFDVFEVPLLTGRRLTPADFDRIDPWAGNTETPTGRGVLVNRTFAEAFFAGASPLGVRIRYVGRSREAGEGNLRLDTWYEVVGVVEDFPRRSSGRSRATPLLYHAAAPGEVHPAVFAIRMRIGDPLAYSARLREIGAVVDLDLQLRNVSTAEQDAKREQGLMRLIGLTLGALTLSVITLSAAGIYSLMSFTVARRRKEIGIRAALGADPARLLTSIFSRAALQLGIGAALGALGAFAFEAVLQDDDLEAHRAIIVPLVALGTILVGLLATIGPARRGLRIQPTDALREE